MIWLLLRGWPWRHLAFILFLPLIFYQAPRPESGQFWATVFDVGQGQAVLIQTQKHNLLFDTGPKYGRYSDAGRQVIIPYLRGVGISRLDGLLVSHDDNDHAGGVNSIVNALEIGWLARPPNSPAYRSRHNRPSPDLRQCLAGNTWQWNHVNFRILHPSMPLATHTNDNRSSCAILIESQYGTRLLLMADQDTHAEAEMMQRWSTALRAEVMLVPHHGSLTSSSPAFIATVQAQDAIVSSGFANPFGHPKAQVLARYQNHDIAVWRTDQSGALRAQFGPTVTIKPLVQRRYWDYHAKQ